MHTAWSGNHTTYAERTPEGDCLLGGGELLAPGEVVLAPGETYHSPWLLGSWSPAGLDPLSHRFHAHLRAVTPRARTRAPGDRQHVGGGLLRPLVDAARRARRRRRRGRRRAVRPRRRLVPRPPRRHRRASATGPSTPRCGPRGSDRWSTTSPARHGVRPLGRAGDGQPRLRGRPRGTPSGCCAAARPCRREWRHQQVLDLQDAAAYADLRDALLALLDDLDIAYLKWDHNRDLTDVAHDGRPAVHGQTLAAYRLLDELRAAHPTWRSSRAPPAAARVDAEVLTRTDRIWPSDTNDPLERQHLQRWTSLLVPPELMGSHVGGPTSHTTGRTHALRYRAATALLHSFGIEWDLTRARRRAAWPSCAAWIDLHKRVRPLIGDRHAGAPRPPGPRPCWSPASSPPTAREAWYVVATVAATATQHPAPLRLAGLDPDRTYRLVEEVPPARWRRPHRRLVGGGHRARGRVLATAGVALPCSTPRRPGAARGRGRRRGLGSRMDAERLGRAVRRQRAGLVGEPNQFVAAELADLPPGRGGRPGRRRGPQRDLAGLARLGGRPRSTSPRSRSTRARRLAGDDLGHGDLGVRRRDDVAAGRAGRPRRGRLPPGAGRRAAARRARGLDVLRPGGTLLLVAHDSTNLTEGTGGPQDPAVLMTAEDVLADLDGARRRGGARRARRPARSRAATGTARSGDGLGLPGAGLRSSVRRSSLARPARLSASSRSTGSSP